MKYHIEFDLELLRNPYKGLFIAIEGIDGSGKTTQIENLKKYFEKKGKSVVSTSEPKRDLIVGKLIHEMLSSKIKIPSKALQYLYSADRVINHETSVIPALKKGAVVLSHRSFWSAIPYGILDKSITSYNTNNTQVILVAHGILSMYHQFIAPDLTFYLDVSADSAIKRLDKMKKNKELYETREKLKKVILGYKWLIKQYPKEVIAIDGEKLPDKITEDIIKHI
ncbi:MAG: dTMP kinase [Patescibacteria group bacterium]|nr:dTMP kinase [Patescibacteria group bacterium]